MDKIEFDKFFGTPLNNVPKPPPNQIPNTKVGLYCFTAGVVVGVIGTIYFQSNQSYKYKSYDKDKKNEKKDKDQTDTKSLE